MYSCKTMQLCNYYVHVHNTHTHTSLMSEMWYISLMEAISSKTFILSVMCTTRPWEHTWSRAGNCNTIDCFAFCSRKRTALKSYCGEGRGKHKHSTWICKDNPQMVCTEPHISKQYSVLLAVVLYQPWSQAFPTLRAMQGWGILVCNCSHWCSQQKMHLH